MQSAIPDVTEDIELNNAYLFHQDNGDKFDEEEFEQDASLPVLSVPKPQRRQEWEFKRRHIEFITLGFCSLEWHDLSPGGTIGIGIFLKSAQALFLGGPVAMILAYLLVGSVAYTITVSLTSEG